LATTEKIADGVARVPSNTTYYSGGNMNLVTAAQIAAPILQTVFIVGIELGYYYSIRVTQNMIQEMSEEHTAGGGRPLITVSEDYANLPNMNIIVQNVGLGPAKDITFEFSAPSKARTVRS
jgi:hypothetical protein